MNDLINRQDAIDAIEGITASMSVCINADEHHGMTRMRRQAVLEVANLPSAQPDPCEDAVSRQAVLDINTQYHGKMPNELNHQIWKDIKELPSAQPERKTGKWIKENIVLTSCPPQYQWHCSECEHLLHGFSADVLTNFCPNCGTYMTEEALDQPEIIYCKACKHWYQDADTGMACQFTNMSQPEDGFCNWGEKNE